jgi:hypothetical protein
LKVILKTHFRLGTLRQSYGGSTYGSSLARHHRNQSAAVSGTHRKIRRQVGLATATGHRKQSQPESQPSILSRGAQKEFAKAEPRDSLASRTRIATASAILCCPGFPAAAGCWHYCILLLLGVVGVLRTRIQILSSNSFHC